MSHFVYIVKAIDDSLYTGYSVDVLKRIKVHNNKRGSKALKGKLPVQLVYQEEYNTKSEALKREFEIKSWPKEKKEKLIAESSFLRE